MHTDVSLVLCRSSSWPLCSLCGWCQWWRLRHRNATPSGAIDSAGATCTISTEGTEISNPRVLRPWQQLFVDSAGYLGFSRPVDPGQYLPARNRPSMATAQSGQLNTPMLSYAVERELLPDNPMAKVKRTAPKMTEEVDPPVVANPAQIRQLLTAVTYVGRRDPGPRRAFDRFLRGGLLRGGSASCRFGASGQDCMLPGHGWAELALGESRPAAGKRWTDSGEVHDRRGLKHRGRKEVRLVQIPPVLVGLLREHLDRFGAGADGRLFRTPSGGVVSSLTYSRIWNEARRYA